MSKIFSVLVALMLVWSAQARDLKFGFHETPPKTGLPQEIHFLYSLKQIDTLEVEATVDLPGLPVIRNFRMGYVAYTGSVPNGWHAVTIEWSAGTDCSLVNVHVAVGAPYRLNQDTLYDELFSLGFRQAVEKLGVDTCGQRQSKDPLLFSFAGQSWTYTQLSEAASEIGVIRAAAELKRPSIARSRLDELLKIDIRNYALSRFLVKRSLGDPKRYEAELGLAIQAFLDRHRKR